MSSTKRHDSGAAEGARRATEDAPESSARAGAGRWSAKRKVSVILELLRGADLESTARKDRVTAAPASRGGIGFWLAERRACRAARRTSKTRSGGG